MLRRTILFSTAGAVAVVMIWVLTRRPSGPGFQATSLESRAAARSVPASDYPSTDEVGSEILPPTATPPPRRSADVGRLVGAAERNARQAIQQWQSVTELLTLEELAGMYVEPQSGRLASAKSLHDSSGALVQRVRSDRDELHRFSRELSGTTGYRLSAVVAAADRLLEQLTEEQRDRQAMLDAVVASLRAGRLGDDAESEIKQNVATSHRLRSEQRQRRLAASIAEMARVGVEAARDR